MATSPISAGAIDVNTIVSQLMQIESRPLTLATQKKTKTNAKISAYGTLTSEMEGFRAAANTLKSADAFKLYKATPGDTDILTATTSTTASEGNYSVNVTALAQSHKLMSASFADKDTTSIGTGTLTISNANSETFTVTIASGDDTLEDIQAKINAASDNFGVTASLLNDGTGYRLTLAANDTGTNGALTVTSADADGNNTNNAGLSRLVNANMTTLQAAQNASFTLDGVVTVTRQTNEVTDAIEGVTLNLVTAGTTTLSIKRDPSAIRTNVQKMVDAYNKLAMDLHSMHDKKGSLAGDATLVAIENDLRSVLNDPANITGNSYDYLSEIGVELQKDGTMTLSSSKFDDALASNYTHVVNLFTDANEGFATRLQSKAWGMLNTDGVMDSRKDGLNAVLTSLDAQISRLELRMTSIEERLRNQYSSLNSMLQQMSTLSSQLVASLSNLGA